MIEGFLVGVIATCSIVAGGFFFKFWRRTHDRLFLAFGTAFVIEAVTRLSLLFVERPSEGRPAMYLVRLLGVLLLVAAIIEKNRRVRGVAPATGDIEP